MRRGRWTGTAPGVHQARSVAHARRAQTEEERFRMDLGQIVGVAEEQVGFIFP